MGGKEPTLVGLCLRIRVGDGLVRSSTPFPDDLMHFFSKGQSYWKGKHAEVRVVPMSSFQMCWAFLTSFRVVVVDGDYSDAHQQQPALLYGPFFVASSSCKCTGLSLQAAV
eukprot:scaffold4247_cov66-Cylindrotheca_fusiformis.AAC.2